MKEREQKSEPALLMILKQAFTMKRSPFPWSKSLFAGLCSGIPVLIGLLFDNLQYRLLAGIGGFTYLYVFPIPYVQLAKKLLFASSF
jgi:hypothetical protein